MSQQSRQALATSSNNPEPSHEPKGPVGRPRNDHGVPTESRKDPLWWNSHPVGLTTTQLSNMGWRKPHFEHFTHQGVRAKRLSKEHYLKELYHLLCELDYLIINTFLKKRNVLFIVSSLCKRLIN